MSLSANGSFDAALPPGVHPNDQTEAVQDGWGTNPAAPPDAAGNRFNVGSAPWSVENPDAVPIYQRQDHDWVCGNIHITDHNRRTIVGRLPGRGPVTVWVPTTIDGVTVLGGVVVGPDEGDLANGGGVTLNIGDSIVIPAESSVYCRLPSGATDGSCQWTSTLNPPGGGLGGQ